MTANRAEAGPPPVVGPDRLDEIADYCRRAAADPPSRDELAGTLFAPDHPAVVRFSPPAGLVATGRHGHEGFVKILALDPARRGRGLGHRLLAVAEEDLAAATVITVGADAPYFLYPGVPATETSLCALLERHHYSREDTNYNMEVDLAGLPADPGGGDEPGADERPVLDAWLQDQWPHWRDEVLRAFDQHTLVVTRDAEGIAAVCAYDVNRARTLGPVASRLELIGKGAATPALLGALHRQWALGYDRVEVLWVGPLVPYARVGGRVGRVFFVYRKRR